MKKLVAIVMASLLAVGGPMTVCAQETIEISTDTEVTEAFEEGQLLEPLSEDEVNIVIDDAFEMVTSLEGREAFRGRYRVDYTLSGAEVSEKKALADLLEGFSSRIPGTDYFANQVVAEAENEERAREIAAGFEGELVSYQDKVAVIETGITTIQAVTMAADPEFNLPAVYPNFYYTTNDEILYELDYGESLDLEELKTGLPEYRDSMDELRDIFDESVTEDYGQERQEDIFLYENGTVASGPPVDDPDLDKQWFHQKINTFDAWEVTKGDGVTVAVIDSGIRVSHPEFRGRVKAVNKVTLDILQNGASDNVGHGTHVAGIIGAAANNGQGGAGVAPEADIISIKALELYQGRGIGSTADIVASVNYAVSRKVDVINMSLGGGGDSYDRLYQQAVDKAVSQGIVVVAAAGNESMDISQSRVVPACFDNVITVASLDPSDALSYFSNYGKIDIAAPGGAGLASGGDERDIYSTSINSDGYEYMAGTSMACPVVSGVAALVIASGSYRKDAAGVEKVTKVLEDSCVDLGDSVKFGAGKVNAEEAVKPVRICAEDNIFCVVSGRSLKLSAEIKNENLRPEWSIVGSGQGCTVSEKGVFKAPKSITSKTTVEVMVRCAGASDTAVVTVYPKAGGITSGLKKSITVPYGKTEKFEVRTEDDVPYTYKTSNARVAVVDKAGVIHGLSNGTATVTATAVGGKKAVVKVRVTDTPYRIFSIEPAGSRDKKGMEMYMDVLGASSPVCPVTIGKSIKFRAVSKWPYNTSSDRKVVWGGGGVKSKVGKDTCSYQLNKNLTYAVRTYVTASPAAGAYSRETISLELNGFKAVKGFGFGGKTLSGGRVSGAKKSTSQTIPAGKVYGVYFHVFVNKTGDSRAVNPVPYVQSSNSDVAEGIYYSGLGRPCIAVSGKSPGKCKLTLISMDGSYKKATINVTVK